MRLTIKPIRPQSDQLYDVTSFLDEGSSQTVTQELEINMFQRTISDVQVSLSDITDDIAPIFDGVRKSHLYQVEFYDDAARRRFWGYIETRTIKFSLLNRTASFSAFSALKRFWDAAKEIKLFFPSAGVFDTTIRLDELFRYEIDNTNIRDGGTNFLGVDLGEFAGVTILGYESGYKGEFRTLSRDTTWYDFLTALCLWYNAEIYIDPVDRNLKMVRRVSILNDRRLDIDTLVCDDEDIDASAIEDKVIDWIEATGVAELSAPLLEGKPYLLDLQNYNNTKGLRGGTHFYRVLYYEKSGAGSFFSDVLAVFLDPVPATARGWRVSIRVQTNPFGYGKRVLYRSDPNDATGGWHWVAEFPAASPTETVFADAVAWVVLQQRTGWPAQDIEPIAAWLNYDEITGEWTEILDIPKGKNTPGGNIFKVYPKLKFLDAYDMSKDLPDDPRWAFQLFTGSVAFPWKVSEDMRARWMDVFRTRRIVECKAVGIDYEVGDSMISKSSFFPNDLTADKRLVIRKAQCDLISNTSKLELVTV